MPSWVDWSCRIFNSEITNQTSSQVFCVLPLPLCPTNNLYNPEVYHFLCSVTLHIHHVISPQLCQVLLFHCPCLTTIGKHSHHAWRFLPLMRSENTWLVPPNCFILHLILATMLSSSTSALNIT